VSEGELEKQRSAFSNGQLQLKIEEQDFSMRYTLYPKLENLKPNVINSKTDIHRLQHEVHLLPQTCNPQSYSNSIKLNQIYTDFSVRHDILHLHLS